MVGKGELEEGPAEGSTPKQEQRKISFFSSLFLSRIFEQKMTVLRNPLLTPLHFYLLF